MIRKKCICLSGIIHLLVFCQTVSSLDACLLSSRLGEIEQILVESMSHLIMLTLRKNMEIDYRCRKYMVDQ